MSKFPPLALPAGVTLRSNRRGLSFGTQIFASYQNEKFLSGLCGWCMIQVDGEHAAEMKKLWSFAKWIYLNSVTGALGGMADKFIITAYVGSAQLAYYGLAQRMMGQDSGTSFP